MSLSIVMRALVLFALVFLSHFERFAGASQEYGPAFLFDVVPTFGSSGGRRLLEEHRKLAAIDSNGGLRAELVFRDSKGSPLRTSSDVEGNVDLSVSELLKRAAERSSYRARVLAKTMGDGSGPDVQPTDFQSPVSIGNGEYVMALELGTPSRRYSVIVDTGSDLTWIQCSPCPQCFGQPSPMFDPSKSSSYKALGCTNNLCQTLPVVESCSPSCQYFYEYGDQSTTVGTFSMETVTMATTSGGSQEVGNVAFGCGHDNQGSFSGVDGLIGLGQGPISFTSQLSTLFGNKFSYCLVSLVDSPSQTSPLLFGTAAIPSGSSVKYTPIVANVHHPTYYYVALTGISVGGNLLNIPASTFAIDPSSGSGGTILDSGTTITQLVNSAYRVVVDAFKSALQYPQVTGSPAGLDLCFDVSGASSVRVPTLTFHFDQADIDLPAENYFVTVDNAGTLCLAMAGSYGFTIYGNIQQQNFQILYDRSGGRAGFKQMKCDTL